jgi:exosortase/archaeosortase family protein
MSPCRRSLARTATPQGRSAALKFSLLSVASSLGFFALLRLDWTATNMLLPLTGVQAAIAAGLFGMPTVPVAVTLECSGADVVALCLGTVSAYPVGWRMRCAGAAAGVALVLGLNTVRIGTLGLAAASPAWFNPLHLYVWPALLTLAVAGYVFAWMRLADRALTVPDMEVASAVTSRTLAPRTTARFVLLTVVFLFVFLGASPLYLHSPHVLDVARFIAHGAAVVLGGLGIQAHAAGSMLWTSRGGFVVTQECISTPLIPIYLAAVCAYSRTRRQLVLGLGAAAPLFISLGVLRVLLVALPGSALGSPLFFVHAFYQTLLGAVMVVVAAVWRHGIRAALRPSLSGMVGGAAFVAVLGPLYARLVTYPVAGRLDDPQGAVALLPAFQIGLYFALWIAAYVSVGWTRLVAGLAVLGLTQTAGLLALQALGTHGGVTAHVRDVRAWAVAGPVLVFAAVISVARARR